MCRSQPSLTRQNRRSYRSSWRCTCNTSSFASRDLACMYASVTSVPHHDFWRRAEVRLEVLRKACQLETGRSLLAMACLPQEASPPCRLESHLLILMSWGDAEWALRLVVRMRVCDNRLFICVAVILFFCDNNHRETRTRSRESTGSHVCNDNYAGGRHTHRYLGVQKTGSRQYRDAGWHGRGSLDISWAPIAGPHHISMMECHHWRIE
ncbi:hypothetical protein QBC41DRAFT_4257 [Cercophora samala]|uniref:Uncharacterized protein n=1 Tax=Cercophora samala TaxID=330535 RepID=A0AA39ZP17_9PEZI|nr:hypothetical protein QBC41DRAFT_4257 [Cercophora samala]